MEGTKIKGIIFDKDGTLYDYVQVWAPVIKNVIRTVFISLNIKDSKEAREHLYQIIGIDNEYNILKDIKHDNIIKVYGMYESINKRIPLYFPLIFTSIKRKAIVL